MKRSHRIHSQLGPGGPVPKLKRSPYASDWEYVEDEMLLLSVLSVNRAEARKGAAIDRAIRVRLKETARAGRRLRGAALLREELSEHERLLVLAVLGERIQYRGGTASMADLRRCFEASGIGMHQFTRHLEPEGRLFRERILRIESDGFSVDREFGIHPEFLQILEGKPRRAAVGRPGTYAGWMRQVFGLLSDDRHPMHRDFELTDRGALTRLVRQPRDRKGLNPFFRACREHALNLAERQVLAILLAGHVFNRNWDFTVEGLLEAIETPVSRYLDRVSLFGREARLRKAKLVEVGSPWRMPDVHFLGSAAVRLSSEGAETLLPRECLNGADDSRLVDVVATPLGLETLVLPEDLLRTTRDLIAFARQGKEVLKAWDLQRITYGTGCGAIFHGPPGTGKTALAGAVARELGRPLHVMETNKVLSMWLGETEQQMARIFAGAEKANAVLFIDEADSFLQDRSRALRSWETTQVNTLLRLIERFNGLVVLATNHAVVLDKALERRLQFKLAFPLPDAAARRAIWAKLLWEKVPLAPEVDLGVLAAIQLSGGQIKNAILNACIRATTRTGAEGPVTQADLLEAAGNETNTLAAKTAGSVGFRAS
jgi:hypothetical protein